MTCEYDDRAPATRIKPSAEKLAKALEDLLSAKKDLVEAKANQPSNLIPGAEDRYFKREQDAYNRAANAYEEAVVHSVKGSL